MTFWQSLMKFHQVTLELSRKRKTSSRRVFLAPHYFPPLSPPAKQSDSKSNQLIFTSNLTFWPSLMKFHQVTLELSRKRKKSSWRGGGGLPHISPPPPPPPATQSHSKSNQLIFTSNLTFWPSLMKFHQVTLELSRKRKTSSRRGGLAPISPPAMQSDSKSNQLIFTSNLTFWPSLMKFHPVILELLRKRKTPAGGGGGGGCPISPPPPPPATQSHSKSNQLIVTSNLTFWPRLMKFHQVTLEL